MSNVLLSWFTAHSYVKNCIFQLDIKFQLTLPIFSSSREMNIHVYQLPYNFLFSNSTCPKGQFLKVGLNCSRCSLIIGCSASTNPPPRLCTASTALMLRRWTAASHSHSGLHGNSQIGNFLFHWWGNAVWIRLLSVWGGSKQQYTPYVTWSLLSRHQRNQQKDQTKPKPKRYRQSRDKSFVDERLRLNQSGVK